MDFITWATATSSRTLLRHLSEMTNNEDDLSAGSSEQQNVVGTTTNTAADNAAADMLNSEKRPPLLSPAAEGELFLLATNFLLYVAMVIIATFVAKIYFPASLERGSSSGRPPMSRSFSYRMVDGEHDDNSSENESYYASDVSDDDDEANEELLGSDDDDEEEEQLVVGMTTTTTTSRRKSQGPLGRFAAPIQQVRNGSGFLEFDQETMSKTEVLKRLLFCSIMLIVTFVMWGILQERMLTRRYPRFTGEYFRYSYALVFTNRFWTLIMSGLLLLYLKPSRSRTTVLYEYSFPSISNMLSSWCQYEALRYVSFPATTLFKSFKLAPVMLMGKILGNKSYPQYDYMVALVIGVGITMFMSSTDDLRFGYDIYGEEASAAWTGIMLLFFFLFFDSFTSQWQSRMFQRHRDLSMVELMFATSAFSTVLSFVTLVHTKELWPAINFVIRHSEIHLHFFMFSICSTIGQLLIFYTIKNFGAVVFTIIMTMRILISIAVSCILYGHQVTANGFLGLMLVMVAVCYRIKRKAEGKQLLKWQGMGDEKAQELVQEWHEHGDM